MPGIVGIIGRGPSSETSITLSAMLECMMHEPTYVSGTLTREDQGLGVGWVSHKDSFSDCMPMWNSSGDICLVFSGEEHSSAETNARNLVKRYEELGGKFFESLNGIFSGLILDLRNNEVVLFNDRYGLNRIYYHVDKERFYFASEAKSLLKVLPGLRRLNCTSLSELFSCGCTLQYRSLFEGVNILPGASKWTFQRQQPTRKETYFDHKGWENQPPSSVSEYYDNLKETFEHILPRYLRGDRRIGLSLTGGLDSRMILACADAQPSTLSCYTFGGMYRECADVRLAKQLARATNQPHETISVTPTFFSEFPELAQKSIYYSDGAMDVTGAVELFANRIARQIAPVRLTGNYGSEILRGNVAFKPGSLCESLFPSAFLNSLKTAAATYAKERAVNRTSFIAFKQVPWHHYARFAVEQSQLTVRSPFLDNELVKLAYRAPAELSLNKDLTHRLIAECYPALAKIPTDRGRIPRSGGSVTKFTMFRQEFMPRAEYVYDYGMPQWLAKMDRLMTPLHIERLFLGRQKFTHFRVWYRNELSNYVKEILLDPRTLSRPYLSGRHVEEAVLAHTSGRGNYTSEIHKLLSSELIQRELIERN